jgi:hypothetical protein
LCGTGDTFPVDNGIPFVPACFFRTLVLQDGEERAEMPTSKKAQRFIRDIVALLIELRVLAAELAFTAAAIYGVYQAFRVLTR